jgi:hypothetical protein
MSRIVSLMQPSLVQPSSRGILFEAVTLDRDLLQSGRVDKHARFSVDA